MSSGDPAQSTVQDAERTIGPSAKWIVLWRGEYKPQGQPSNEGRRGKRRSGWNGSGFGFRLLVVPVARIGRLGEVGLPESEHQVGVTHAQFPHGKVTEPEQHL